MQLVEQHLRESLIELADQAEVNVRAADVVAGGQRLVRLHTMGRAMTAVAAFAVVVAGGWQLAMPRAVTVQPAPVATPLVANAPAGMAYAAFEDARTGWRHSVQVRVEPDGASWRITVDQQVNGRQQDQQVRSAPRGEVWSSVLKDSLALTLLPDARAALAVDSPGVSSYSRIAHLDISLILFRPDPSQALSAAPRVVFSGRDGRIRATDGSNLPSAQLATDHGSITVFQDGKDYGLFTDSGGTFLPISGDPTRREIKLGMAAAGMASAGMLPVGARDARVTVRSGDVAVARLPTGRLWFLATSKEPQAALPTSTWLVRSVDYTDAEGVRRSYVPDVVP